MSQTDEKSEQMTNMERLREQASACGPGCDCNAGPSGRARWVVGAIIVVIAGVLVARAVMKDDSSQAQGSDTNFALPQPSAAKPTTTDSAARVPEDKSQAAGIAAPPEAAADKPENKPVICGELIRSLNDLNSKAVNKNGVFVFLAGHDAVKNREIAAVIEKGAATLRRRKISMGVFTLKDGSSEYANLARQAPPPSVLAMVKGRGASAVTDDVTESKLLQAFVAASSAGGCGSSGAARPAVGKGKSACWKQSHEPCRMEVRAPSRFLWPLRWGWSARWPAPVARSRPWGCWWRIRERGRSVTVVQPSCRLFGF